MELIGFQKDYEGAYLKNYGITYLNKEGKPKKYEIVSRRELQSPQELGKKASGVSIVGFFEDRFLLLQEFRIGANKEIYNLCAGNIEENESVEGCIKRELFEETGLKVKRILKILPPAFVAVAISDILNYIAFVEVEGSLSSQNTSANEQITPGLYTAEDLKQLLTMGESFTTRAQCMAYFFSEGLLKKELINRKEND